MTEANMQMVDAKNAGEVARVVKDGAVVGPSTVRRSASIRELAGALVKAQHDIRNPRKTETNTHFRNKYADLAGVRDAVIPAFNAHGLSVLQLLGEMDDAPALVTVLLHTSGEWYESTWKLRSKDAGNPQALGSVLTYYRRYSLLALGGCAADDDDDGNAGAAEPAPAPRANNPQAVARLAQRFAQVATPEQLQAVYVEVQQAARRGELSEDDRQKLRLVAGETDARVNGGGKA